jgi:hypothetical protein
MLRCQFCKQGPVGLLDRVLAAMRNRGKEGVDVCERDLARCLDEGGPTKYWTIQGIRLAILADRRNRHWSGENDDDRDR